MRNGAGTKYEETKDLDLAAIAKLVRADIKAQQAELAPGGLPRDLKVSVRISRYSMGQSLTVEVSKLPEGMPALNAERLRAEIADPHGYIPARQFPRSSSEVEQILRQLKAIVDSYNFDESDIQSDYSSVRFYDHVQVDWRIETVERDAAKAAAS